ncbi:zinc finger protein draculin-like [Cloeon dipterum]|uniref:zinc finger protein draculin-like n=1 Tax=Cloeon dipterum TaxID=197152 RepID=UPI00321FF59D
MYNSLMNHIKYSHKEAIKCGILGCATFFHTEEEKEQHMQQVSHEKRNKPCKSKEIRCKYCESDKLYSTLKSLRLHMKRLHPEFSMRCSRVGCQEFFKSKSEMVAHINSWHKRGQKQRVLQCKQCEYFTRHDEHILRRHVESKHMPKTFKCDRCDAKFGSKAAVDKHFIQFHTFVNCKTCGQDVALGHKPYHGKPSVCYRCKLRFKCSGLYQSHREKCKQTLLTCKVCGKSFPVDSRLKNHVKNVHTKTMIFRCEHCDHSTHDKIHMQGHMQRKHLPKTIKCELCDKSFATESLVNIHKSAAHSFIHCAECAQEILRVHKSTHMSVKSCRRCKCKFKCQGLLEIHSNKSCQNNNYCCDICQKYFKNKADLYTHMVNNHIRVYK